MMMVQFSNPAYEGTVKDDPKAVTVGPYNEVRISEDCLYGDFANPEMMGSDPLGYFDRDDNVWVHNDLEYTDVKIFAAPVVVPT